MAVEDLTPKQSAFVDAIISNMGQAESYRHAGYVARNDNVASASANKLLSNPKISAAIARHKAGIAERVDVSQDRLVSEYWSTYHAARELETPNLTAARQCLDSLARITGLFDAHSTSTLDVRHTGQVTHALAQASMAQLDFILASSDAELLALQSPTVEID
jgi:phage terminase small subunit